MKLTEESSSSSRGKDEVSAIGVEPINLAEPAAWPATQAIRSVQRGIVIKEPVPQEQPTQEKVPEGKAN